MNIMPARNAFLFCGLLCVAEATAQQPTPPPLPPGPLVQARAPSNSLWSTVVKSASAVPDASPKTGGKDQQDDTGKKKEDEGVISKKIFRKDKGVILVTYVQANNQLFSVWCVGASELIEWSGGKGYDLLTPSPNPDNPNPYFTDFSKGDFQGLDWIDRASYVGLVTYQGIKCIYYKKESPMSASVGASSLAAYVEIESRLPIAVLNGGELTEYKWEPPPPAPLNIPPGVTARIKEREQNFQKIKQVGVKP